MKYKICSIHLCLKMKGTFNSLLDYVILLTPSTTVVLNFVLKKNLISKLDFGFYCAIHQVLWCQFQSNCDLKSMLKIYKSKSYGFLDMAKHLITWSFTPIHIYCFLLAPLLLVKPIILGDIRLILCDLAFCLIITSILHKDTVMMNF